MNPYTLRAKAWLEERFSRGVKEGRYFAHQPIYGYGNEQSEINHTLRLARTFSILKRLNRIPFHQAIDIGGGEGYMSHLVSQLFGVPVYSADLSFQANLRARELFGLRAVALEASLLPIKDSSFDLVMACEVLEHLEHPLEAILELLRITRKYLLITTEQACLGAIERHLRQRLVDGLEPHGEKNYFTPEDFRLLLGSSGLTICQQLHSWGWDLKDKAKDAEELKAAIGQLCQEGPFSFGSHGLLLLKAKNPGGETLPHEPQWDESALLERLLDVRIDDQYKVEEPPEGFDLTMLDFLCCSKCKEELTFEEDALLCSLCSQRFPVKRGIPLLYPQGPPDHSLEALREKLRTAGFSQGKVKKALSLKRGWQLKERLKNLFLRRLYHSALGLIALYNPERPFSFLLEHLLWRLKVSLAAFVKKNVE